MNQYRTSVPCTFLLAMVTLAICSCSRRIGPSVIDADAPQTFTETDSGLKYRILRRSNGRKPLPSERVQVDYSGWLDDGSLFDSSYDRHEPAIFSLGNLVEGWNEGLLLIGEGGMIELEVPPELGYGAAGQLPNIPPHSTLHFKVELLRIE